MADALLASTRSSLESILRQVRVNDPPADGVRTFGEKLYNSNPARAERAAVAVALQRRDASDFLKRRVAHAKMKIDAAKYLRTRAGKFRVTAGPCVGVVRPTSALIWARGASSSGFLQFEVFTDNTFAAEPVFRQFLPCDAATDYAQCAQVEGLSPATTYHVRVEMCRNNDSESTPTNLVAAYADFRTPPLAATTAAVSFVVGMSLEGNGSRGVFDQMLQRRPAFAVLGGGVLSADAGARAGYPAPDRGAGSELDAMRAKYRAQSHDRHVRKFLCRTPVWVAGGANVASSAEAQAYAENWPCTAAHTSFRHGALLEVFHLDTRAFHAGGGAENAAEAGARGALDAEQLRWLQDALVASSAVWKVVVCDVPLLVAEARVRSATGGGSAGVAAAAWHSLLSTMRSSSSRNFAWISHLPPSSGAIASVASCDPFGEGIPLCHELSLGSLHTGSIFDDAERDAVEVNAAAEHALHAGGEEEALLPALGDEVPCESVDVALSEAFRPTLICALAEVRFVLPFRDLSFLPSVFLAPFLLPHRMRATHRRQPLYPPCSPPPRSKSLRRRKKRPPRRRATPSPRRRWAVRMRRRLPTLLRPRRTPAPRLPRRRKRRQSLASGASSAK
jgi:phosphodiesterase/alkaline phosphatase D-like protein